MDSFFRYTKSPKSHHNNDGFVVKKIDPSDNTMLLESLSLQKKEKTTFVPPLGFLIDFAMTEVWAKIPVNTIVEEGQVLHGKFSHYPQDSITKGIPTFIPTEKRRSKGFGY